MSAIEYIILIAAPLIGGIFSFWMRHKKDQNLRLMLAFSGSFLFATVILHLLPELYLQNKMTIAPWILLGFIIQLILELFTRGIEHGHLHSNKKHNHQDHIHSHTTEEHSSFYAASVLIGLSIHSFIEGLPLNTEFAAEEGHNSLFLGVVLHKIPAAFALMSIATVSKMKNGYLLVVAYALMTPLGALCSHWMKNNNMENFMQYNDIFLALAVGSFFHISTTILFESATKNHSITFFKFTAIIVGAALAFITH